MVKLLQCSLQQLSSFNDLFCLPRKCGRANCGLDQMVDRKRDGRDRAKQAEISRNWNSSDPVEQTIFCSILNCMIFNPMCQPMIYGLCQILQLQHDTVTRYSMKLRLGFIHKCAKRISSSRHFIQLAANIFLNSASIPFRPWHAWERKRICWNNCEKQDKEYSWYCMQDIPK